MENKGFLKHPQAVLLLLCLIALLSYGQLIVEPGLYGDDPVLLAAHLQGGADGIQRVLGWSRPYGAWVYKAILPMLGTQVVCYQVLAILLRILGAWVLYLALAETHPNWREPARWAALACLVYTGFTQQAQSLQFLLHWTVLSVTLLSIWLMLKAEEALSQPRQTVLRGLACLLALGMFGTEYFIGLEVLRPALLWVKVQRKYPGRQAMARTAAHWLPYVLLLVWMVIWRLCFADIAYPQPLLLADLAKEPMKGIPQTAARAVSDIWLAGVAAWGSPVSYFSTVGLAWQAVLAGGLAFGLLLLAASRTRSEPEKILRGNGLLLAGLGVAAMLAGGMPLWISQTPLALTSPWSRTTLCLMVGTCMALVGAACLLPLAWRRVLLSLLLGLSVGFQHQTSRTYLQEWENLRQIFWQLAWRAPGLQPGTLVLFEHLPISYYSANSLDPILNLTYDPQGTVTLPRYRIFEISERLGGVLPALQPGLEIRHGGFTGNTSQALVITWGADGCLQVLEPGSSLAPGTDPLLWEARHISNPEMILPNASPPARPPEWLGAEPDHSQCTG